MTLCQAAAESARTNSRLFVGGSTTSENDGYSLKAATADWTVGNLAAAIVDIGAIADNDDGDTLIVEEATTSYSAAPTTS